MPKPIKQEKFTKVVDERHSIPLKRGGGLVRVETWEDKSGEVVKYNIAYINHAVYQNDNGRVFGYDNAHNYHHRHYHGYIYPVNDFVSYEDIAERFELELKEFLS